MGFINKYGLISIPNSIIRGLATGWLNGWAYDYSDPLNYLRDTSIQIRNNCDRLLADYTKQLKDDLSKFRKTFPEPTRENPFPPKEMLDAAKEMSDYIRLVEDLRTMIVTASIPPKEMIRHSKNDNVQMLSELEVIDKEMIETLSVMDDSKIDMVKNLLKKRNAILMNF